MAAPLYNVGDILYLRESARLGSLESYEITQVRQDASGSWWYKFGIPQRPGTNTTTVGDRNTLRGHNFDFELEESELIAYCDAIDLVEAYLIAALTRIQALKAAQCAGTE